MHKKDWRNPATNVIVFDPAMKSTGWLWYKPEPHKIEKYGVIRKADILHGQTFSGVLDEYMAFQQRYAERLVDILRWYDPEWTQVVMERPTGTQSAKAAWAMAMASTAVTTVTRAVMRKDPIVYTEREAKMYAFETNVVPKSKIVKHMWNYWKGQGIKPAEETWKNETRNAILDRSLSDVADAMLLLNLHIHKMS